MHRTIEITIPPKHTDTLVGELEDLENVLGLSVQRGASIKPKGDIVTVQALNRGADDVLRRVQEAQARGISVSVATSALSSIIDKEHQQQIKDDFDQELWEEMETGLRHQSHDTSNFLLLMALGGAIAAAVHLDQVAHDGQPESETAIFSGGRAVSLAEAVEDMGQELLADPVAAFLD